MSEVITDKLTGKTAAGNVTITSEGGSATMQLQQGVAKAWIDIPLGAASINDSFNVSSLDDDGTGDFGVNVTNSFVNAFHVPTASNSNASSTVLVNCIIDSKTTSAIEASTIYVSSTANRTYIDRDAHITSHGDLA
jgi:hypothetical protein